MSNGKREREQWRVIFVNICGIKVERRTIRGKGWPREGEGMREASGVGVNKTKAQCAHRSEGWHLLFGFWLKHSRPVRCCPWQPDFHPWDPDGGSCCLISTCTHGYTQTHIEREINNSNKERWRWGRMVIFRAGKDIGNIKTNKQAKHISYMGPEESCSKYLAKSSIYLRILWNMLTLRLESFLIIFLIDVDRQVPLDVFSCVFSTALLTTLKHWERSPQLVEWLLGGTASTH